ncbi:cupin-like domain-containing protein, partial [Klebsiella pneumoniae]|uniref:cupin-like domain-containing protein n=1 Tax=Klebsiella pneumoniae TaxID=573 RepID=UPI003904B1DE
MAPPDVFEKNLCSEPSDILETDGNTSSLAIFDSTTTTSLDPRLHEVKERSSRVILSPGDLLVMPPGWFHGMRSLTRVSLTP